MVQATEAAADATKALEELKVSITAELAKGQKADSERVEALAKQANEKIDALNALIEKRFNAGKVPGLEDEKEVFNTGKLLQALNRRHMGSSDPWHGAEFERDACKAAAETYSKAMGTVPDSGGGEIVPMQSSTNVIDSIRARSIIQLLGATEIGGLTGSPYRIPRISGNTTVYWIGENPSAAVTASDMTLQSLKANPHRVAARTTFSDQLESMSNPSVVSMLERNMGASLALEQDRVAFFGSGASNEPLGLSGYSTGSVTWSATVQTAGQYSSLVSMEENIATSNALTGKLGWAMSPKLFFTLRQLKSEATSGAWLGMGNQAIDMGKPTSIIGYPFQLSTQLTTSTPTYACIFGNWEELYVFRWGTLIVRITDAINNAAGKFQKDLIMALDTDIGVAHAASFCTAGTTISSSEVL